MKVIHGFFGALVLSLSFAACGDDDDDNGGDGGGGSGPTGGTAGKGGSAGKATGGTPTGGAGGASGGSAGKGGASGAAGKGGASGASTGGISGAGGEPGGEGGEGGAMGGQGGAGPENCDPVAPPAIFVGVMTGAQEVPPVTTTATGVVIAELNAAETELTTSVYWSGLTTNTSLGHIHGPAVAGMTAPPVFNYNPPTTATSGSIVAMTFPINTTQVGYLKTAQLYANIHSTMNGTGEIRAQLLPATILRTGTLVGAEEVPPVTTTATGRAVVVVFPNNTQAAVSVTWSGLTTGTHLGHIHGSAPPGMTAPPMLDLMPTLGATSGAVRQKLWDLTAPQSTALLANLTYANIHSTMFMAGEIRAQLLPPCP